jgi:hypothetical protein
MQRKVHYVNNSDFYSALCEYLNEKKIAEQNNLPAPIIPKYIGECILKIAYKLASKGNFCNYSYKDEMVSDGIENCINYIHNFNPEKTNNPFAYFTRILWNAYILRIQKEKKQQYIKYKSLENLVITNGVSALEDSDSPNPTAMSNYENINLFVSEYEKKLTGKTAFKKKGLEVFIPDGEENEQIAR